MQLCLAGCGYQFTSRSATRLGSGQSVWVPFIANESISSTAQTVIRRGLLAELHALRGMQPAAGQGAADLVVSGRLVSYGNKPISYTALDRVREYRLTLEVELSAARKGEDKPFWKGTLSGSRDYPSNSDLALQRNSEEAALEAASRTVAQRLITSLEQNF